ncbi:hypothetical protein IFM89_019426 [Coptis chinensis]|uniref:Uncharacterized protein n=1 Tax=Coptis chinensis TaxID=261450 RepID=A0A835M6S8_9MAGN|nr:hypothetical protein IFM89_019426 [Coptis chinensis]
MAALSTPLQYNCPLSQKKTPLQLACKVRGMTTLSTPSQLVYKVRRNEPELLAPATPTPYELKYLSDIDDQKSLRIQIPIVYFYTNNIVGIGMKKRDPVKVIKEAIAKALVYYYPFAGRLREGRNDKLMVECTGEGVMFIEADADVRLDQLVDDTLKPPFPCMQDLLYNVPGSNNILNCPLLLIQVISKT